MKSGSGYRATLPDKRGDERPNYCEKVSFCGIAGIWNTDSYALFGKTVIVRKAISMERNRRQLSISPNPMGSPKYRDVWRLARLSGGDITYIVIL